MIRKLLAVSLAMAVAFGAMAGPDIYLRGDKCGNWAVSEQYRFSENGGVYTLHVDRLSGDFKIATEDWTTVDYGSAANAAPLTGYGDYIMVSQGGNFKCGRDLTDVTLSFMNNGSGSSVLTINCNEAPGEVSVTGLSGTLPVLYINVYADKEHTALNNEIISRDLAHKDYFKYAEYWLDLNGCTWMEEAGAASIGSAEAPLPLQIKARGNWTRVGFSKKPFKLKLDEKQKMLGLSKSKHFAILAHADDDKGYMKNMVGFSLGRRIGLPWTPSHQPVEVVVNGDYRGLYFLTESIRVEKDRVNIEELADNETDTGLVSGGYLVELDNYDEENQIQMEEKTAPGVGIDTDMLRVTWDTPEEYSEIQKRFVRGQFEAINDAIGDNSDAVWSYLDLDDAARYYIVEEIISHVEAYHGSTYLIRDRGADRKWHFSPLWDCGNAFNGPKDDFFYRHAPYGSTWIPSMRVNSKFNTKVAETWMWFMTNGYKGLEDEIDTYALRIAKAAACDRARWKEEPAPAGGLAVVDNSDMEGRRQEVKNHLAAKIEWLRGQFGDYTALSEPAAEPARDTTPAAALPDYLTSAVENMETAAAVGEAVYYDLTGMKVSKPAAGSVVIELRGGKARKVTAR